MIEEWLRQLIQGWLRGEYSRELEYIGLLFPATLWLLAFYYLAIKRWRPAKTGTMKHLPLEAGDRVAKGQPIAEVQIGSERLEVLAPAAGFFEEYLVESGEPIEAGDCIGLLSESKKGSGFSTDRIFATFSPSGPKAILRVWRKLSEPWLVILFLGLALLSLSISLVYIASAFSEYSFGDLLFGLLFSIVFAFIIFVGVALLYRCVALLAKFARWSFRFFQKGKVL